VAQAAELLSSTNDLTLTLDSQGRVLDALSRDPGLQSLSKSWVGRPWMETVTSESRPKVQSLLDEALLHGTSQRWRQLNHPQVAAGAHVPTLEDVPITYSALCLHPGQPGPGSDPDGDPGSDPDISAAAGQPRLVVSGRDLRGVVQLQRNLVESQQALDRDYWRFREAETRYRTLFQTADEAMLIADHPALKVQECNAAAQTLLAGGAKLNGSAMFALFHSADQPLLSAAMAEVRGSGQHRPLQLRLAHSDVSVLLSLSSLKQQQDSLWLLRFKPVVPRGELAAPALASHTGRDAWLRSFAEHSTEALVFTDLQGRILLANPAFAAQAQLASAEVARGEMLDRWLGSTSVELPVLITNLRQRGAVAYFATRLRAEGGTKLEVELSATVLPIAEATEPGSGRQASRALAQGHRQRSGRSSGRGAGQGIDQSAGPSSELLVFVLRDAGRRAAAAGADNPSLAPTAGELGGLVGRMPMKEIVSETSDMIEKLCIETALQMTSDNRALAAQLLGISRQSLYVKLRRYGLGELEPEN